MEKFKEGDYVVFEVRDTEYLFKISRIIPDNEDSVRCHKIYNLTKKEPMVSVGIFNPKGFKRFATEEELSLLNFKGYGDD